MCFEALRLKLFYRKIVYPDKLDSGFNQPVSCIWFNVNVVFVKATFSVAPEKGIARLEQDPLRTAQAVGFYETLVDRVDVMRNLYNFCLSEQTFKRQGSNLCAAFDEVCWSINVRSRMQSEVY